MSNLAVRARITLLALLLLTSCSSASAARNQTAGLPPAPIPPVSSSIAQNAPVAESKLNDCPNEASPYSIQPLYVIPRDGADRHLHVDGTLSGSIRIMQAWFKSQSGSCLRFARQGNAYSVGLVRLDETGAELNEAGSGILARIEQSLARQGYSDRRQIYAVYYDGASSFISCGAGSWPPANPGRVSVVYVQGHPPGSSPCTIFRFAPAGSPPGYMEFFMLHEILHTMGYVSLCAPNHTLNGHVSDSTADLLWAGDGSWKPSSLDVGRDDYFGHGQPGCPDLARSVFLDPLPDSPEIPPSWPTPAS